VRARILIVDDDMDMRDVLSAGLSAREFEAVAAVSADDALGKLEQQEFDAVVTDLFMKGTNGIQLCARLTANFPNIPVVVITAFGSLETAIAAIRAGAYDFVTKPLDTQELALVLERAIQLRGLREEVKRLRYALDRSEQFSSLVGQSSEMQKLRALLARIANSEAAVLITGETGTGKELAARGLHESGRRRDGPFVAVNCAAVPENLIESELFGHAKGAYTDAKTQRSGLFVHAQGGTLFLDEIGSMPVSVQPKLLRALQDRRVRPVGSDNEMEVDVRIVSATNRDLESAVAEGRFRDDLYYRITSMSRE